MDAESIVRDLEIEAITAPYGTAGRLRLAAREITRLRAELAEARRERDALRIIAEKAAKEECQRFHEGDCNSWRDPRRCAPCEARAFFAAPSAPAPGEGGGA